MKNELINATLTADFTSDVFDIPTIGLFPQSRLLINGFYAESAGTHDAVVTIYAGIDENSMVAIATHTLNSTAGTFYTAIDNYGFQKLKITYTENSATSVELTVYDNRIH